jgi:hypothetical protein
MPLWSPTRPPAAIPLEQTSPDRHIRAQLRRSVAFCLVLTGPGACRGPSRFPAS